MSNGNWGVRIAALGAALALAFVAFGTGVYWEGLNYPKQERYQTYRYAPGDPEAAEAALLDKTKPVEYREPCKQPEGHDESDLCAQWKAARAAERGALWTEIGVIVAFAGIVGLVVTLWFNFEAWRQAKESKTDTNRALDAADRNADAASRMADNLLKSNRPLIYVKSIAPERREEAFGRHKFTSVYAKLTVKNSGLSPGIIRVVRYVIERGVDGWLPALSGRLTQGGFRVIGAGEETDALADAIRFQADIFPLIGARTAEEAFTLIPTPKGPVRLRGHLIYSDFHGTERISGFAIGIEERQAGGPFYCWYMDDRESTYWFDRELREGDDLDFDLGAQPD